MQFVENIIQRLTQKIKCEKYDFLQLNFWLQLRMICNAKWKVNFRVLHPNQKQEKKWEIIGENMRAVNSLSHSCQPSVCKCHCHNFQNGRISQLHSARMTPERNENGKKTGLTGDKKTIRIRLKSVRRNDCGRKMHGRGPGNSDPLPDNMWSWRSTNKHSN